jgi:hypothetical protein
LKAITKVGVANKDSGTLRTSIPAEAVKDLGLKDGSAVEWTWDPANPKKPMEVRLVD